LRESVTNIAEGVLDSFEKPSKKTLNQFRKTLAKEVQKSLQSEFGPALSTLPKYKRNLIKRLAMQQARTTDLSKELPNTTRKLREMVDVPTVLASSHIKSLSKENNIENWHKRFEKLEWSLLESSFPEVIHGDCGPIAMTNEKRFSNPLSAAESISCMVLPVARDKVLIGVSDVPPPTIAEINKAIAELSRSFFIAGRKTSEELLRQGQIGKSAELFTAAELLAD
jgi:hypothetical protein